MNKEIIIIIIFAVTSIFAFGFVLSEIKKENTESTIKNVKTYDDEFVRCYIIHQRSISCVKK